MKSESLLVRQEVQTSKTSEPSQTTWGREQLIAMLKNRNLSSTRLILKDGDTEVQRLMHNDKVCVFKRYKMNLAANQSREFTFLFDSQFLKPAIKEHVVPLVTISNRASQLELDFYTEWSGFDLDQWHVLLGADHPYMNTIPGLLSLIYGVLNATKSFHAEGYVHNDLHYRNLVMDYRYDASNNTGELDLDSIRMIDFEFSLKPRFDKQGRDLRAPPIWEDQKNSEILLNPAFHSEYVCGFETEYVRKNDKLVQAYRRDARGFFIHKSTSLETRRKVGFGVDFFTLAYDLRELIQLAEKYWSDPHVSKYDAAHDYLLALPDRLDSYNTDPNQPAKAAPHQQLMDEINALVHINKRAHFSLPLQSGVEAQGAESTILNTVGKTRKTLNKIFPNRWPLAGVLIASFFGAVVWMNVDTAQFRNWFKTRVQQPVESMNWFDKKVQTPVQVISQNQAEISASNAETNNTSVKDKSTSNPYPNKEAAQAALLKWNASTYGSSEWLSSLQTIIKYYTDQKVDPAQQSAIFDAIKLDYSNKSSVLKKQSWWISNRKEDLQTSNWLIYSKNLSKALVLGEISTLAQLNLLMAQASGKSLEGQLVSPTLEARQHAVVDLARQLSMIGDLKKQDYLHKTSIDAATLLYQLMQASQHGGDALISPAEVLKGIKKVADLPDQNLQILLGYAASCYLPAPDHALALAYFKKAQTPGLYPAEKAAIKQLPAFIELSSKKDIACS